MPGLLLIAPTGSGKTTTLKTDSFFHEHALDGDNFANYSGKKSATDDAFWKKRDRENLTAVVDKMRRTGKCVLWYVGTTAVSDAIADNRLDAAEVVVVLIPEAEHLDRVIKRDKPGHGPERALEHRALCESLIQQHGLRQFASFLEAKEWLSVNNILGVK